MLMRLEMPLVDASLRGGRVLRWNKDEGDTFAFGEEICVIAVDQFAAVRRTGRATKLSRRRRRIREEVEVREGKVYVEVGLNTADTGVVRKIVAGDGDPVGVGDLLAVVSTTENDELGGAEEAWRQAPELRVAANVKHRDDFEEGD